MVFFNLSNNGLSSRYGDRLLVSLGISVSLLLSACGENKYTQCEQIFQIAHRVTNNSKNITYASGEQLKEMKNWLTAADLMTKAAQQIKALHINDPQLIEYQAGLANIYQIYSQATYDAVKARENKNINALKTARNHAEKAGNLQQSLVEKINAYCLNQSSSF